MLSCDAVRGGGAEREQWRRLHQISIYLSATHNQTGPLRCWFPSGWSCARYRPLWVSPRTCPVRLGVSPAAAPTPTGTFSQRSEALFPGAGALGYMVCFAPRQSSRFICARVWSTGSASGQTACPFHPTLHQSHSRHGHVSPLCPSYRSGCMFLFYLLGVGLPCRLIFCQFWLGEEAQCVYLCRHLGSPRHHFLNSSKQSYKTDTIPILQTGKVRD